MNKPCIQLPTQKKNAAGFAKKKHKKNFLEKNCNQIIFNLALRPKWIHNFAEYCSLPTTATANDCKILILRLIER
jgi:hypothetical protein